MRIKKYHLIKIDGHGKDIQFTTVFTSTTLRGLIRYSNMKDIDFYSHTVEEGWYDENGLRVEEKKLGRLWDLI